MTRRVRVGVIFGGRSGEHEVSLVSARSVMDALDPDRYEVVPIGIARDGTWLLTGDPHRELTAAAEAAKRALAPGGPHPLPLSGAERGDAASNRDASIAAEAVGEGEPNTSGSLPLSAPERG